MSAATPVSAEMLKRLQPIGAMSDARLAELASLTFVEHVSRTLDPFQGRPDPGTSIYLLRGELAIDSMNGGLTVIVGGTEEASHPLGRRGQLGSARAITDIDLVRFDNELIDIMMTWDQIATVAADPDGAANDAVAGANRSPSNWHLLTGMFSVNNLRVGVLSRLPTAHIGRLLTRFERIEAKRGVAVVHEGDAGDYYYVIESGRAEVTRKVGGVAMKLAQLKSGDAFGEEALLSDIRRNATVMMVADGSLFRLSKAHFDEMLRAPLLREVPGPEAKAIVARGGQWIDVRYPSEYQFDRLPDALNIPLGEVRNAPRILDPGREYVVYCQTGRRSAAAAFLLAQRGLNTYVLAGGLAAFRSEHD
ncbi:MAG: cyclic nucleotide-binding domain-containing protein [Burkholderiales bacterium]